MKTRVLLFGFFALFALAQPADADPPDCWKCFIDPLPPFCFLCGYSSAGGSDCQLQSCRECTNGSDCGWAGGGCFLPGTLVETPSGAIPIEDIVPGDIVIGSDPDGRLSECFVADTYKIIGRGYYLINGTLRVTASHPFWVDGAWREAKDLHVGDQLHAKDGSNVTIVTIDFVDKSMRAYNVEVSGAHTFFADGLLVHNKPPDPGN